MKPKIYFTYTCPVSRKTYAGHPRNGYLYVNDNDLEEAILTIHSIARTHKQPVTWVINDQEYTDQEGLLHYFKQYQEEGDAVLVTMELTTDPLEVDKYDTTQVIRWIDARCKDAGIRIDGLWSLKFLESDLAAISSLPRDEFSWTRNLAGSCWHQYGIDDSTWGGCPFMPYYPSLRNSRGVAREDELGEFLMLEWLSRDPNAILHGGGAAVFSLDPADSNRVSEGGFDNERDALIYSNALISELARQSQLNDMVVIDVNEEARHYQTEGHDKSYMLDGMFRHAGELDVPVERITYRDLWTLFRERYPVTPERFLVCKNLDFRKSQGYAVIYEDEDVQMAFIEEHGNFPSEYFDYRMSHPGKDSNDPYPMVRLPELKLISLDAEGGCIKGIVSSPVDFRDCGFMLWNLGFDLRSRAEVLSENITVFKLGLDGHAFVRMNLNAGENEFFIDIQQ